MTLWHSAHVGFYSYLLSTLLMFEIQNLSQSCWISAARKQRHENTEAWHDWEWPDNSMFSYLQALSRGDNTINKLRAFKHRDIVKLIFMIVNYYHRLPAHLKYIRNKIWSKPFMPMIDSWTKPRFYNHWLSDVCLRSTFLLLFLFMKWHLSIIHSREWSAAASHLCCYQFTV